MHTNTLAIIRRATLKNSQRLSVRHCHPGKTGVWRLYKHSLADKHGRGFKAFQITDYHQISSCREALDKHLLLYSNAAHPRGQRLTLFASSGPAELTLNAPSWTDTPSSSAGCKDLIEPQTSLHLEVRTVSWHSDVAPSPTRQQHYDMSQKGRKKSLRMHISLMPTHLLSMRDEVGALTQQPFVLLMEGDAAKSNSHAPLMGMNKGWVQVQHRLKSCLAPLARRRLLEAGRARPRRRQQRKTSERALAPMSKVCMLAEHNTCESIKIKLTSSEKNIYL